MALCTLWVLQQLLPRSVLLLAAVAVQDGTALTHSRDTTEVLLKQSNRHLHHRATREATSDFGGLPSVPVVLPAPGTSLPDAVLGAPSPANGYFSSARPQQPYTVIGQKPGFRPCALGSVLSGSGPSPSHAWAFASRWPTLHGAQLSSSSLYQALCGSSSGLPAGSQSSSGLVSAGLPAGTQQSTGRPVGAGLPAWSQQLSTTGHPAWPAWPQQSSSQPVAGGLPARPQQPSSQPVAAGLPARPQQPSSQPDAAGLPVGSQPSGGDVSNLCEGHRPASDDAGERPFGSLAAGGEGGEHSAQVVAPPEAGGAVTPAFGPGQSEASGGPSGFGVGLGESRPGAAAASPAGPGHAASYEQGGAQPYAGHELGFAADDVIVYPPGRTSSELDQSPPEAAPEGMVVVAPTTEVTLSTQKV